MSTVSMKKSLEDWKHSKENKNKSTALTSLVCSDWQEQDRKPYKQFLFGIMLHVV